MNILPKKKWHVRTKDNIARVRRDEAQAAGEENDKQRRIALAEQEARTELLRQRARGRIEPAASSNDVSDIQPEPVSAVYQSRDDHRLHEEEEEAPNETADPDSTVIASPDTPENDVSAGQQFLSEIFGHFEQVPGSAEHVNLFRDAQERNGKDSTSVNADHEAEKKAEKEKYEKSIGYLTYLGQSAQESQHVLPWYTLSHQNRTEVPTSSGMVLRPDQQESLKNNQHKWKDLMDPLRIVNTHLKRSTNTAPFSALKIEGPASRPAICFPPSSADAGLIVSLPAKQHSSNIDSEDQEETLKKSHRKKHKKPHMEAKIAPLEKNTDAPKVAGGKTMEELRKERLRREHQERQRTQQLLASKAQAVKPEPVADGVDDRCNMPRRKQLYNSQFNPDLARQNVRFAESSASDPQFTRY